MLKFELLQIYGSVNGHVFPGSPQSVGCTLYKVKHTERIQEVTVYEIITSSNILSDS